jgi:hypothetical protein
MTCSRKREIERTPNQSSEYQIENPYKRIILHRPSTSLLGRYTHHIVLAVIIGSVLAASSVALANSTSSAPKVLWSTNPITMTFSHNTGHGSATDSFKCAPPVISAVVLTSSVSPSGASLLVNPSGFATCGPSFQSFTLDAQSTTTGTYRGVVTVSQLAFYQSIPPSLTVVIVVT